MVYHVRITKKDGRIGDVVELDLSKEDLIKNIVTPFEKGKKFFCNGEIINPFNIEIIRINETEETSNILIPKIRAERERSNFVVTISDEWDVTEKGKNVTREFIKNPPKNKILSWKNVKRLLRFFKDVKIR